MIKESLYFTFDGRKSTDFNLINVSINPGLYEENLSSSRSIIEQNKAGVHEPYFLRVQRDPITIPLTFCFKEQWNTQLIDEILDWLDVDNYKQLAFNGDFDRLFYAMPIENISLVHNGLKQGYMTLNMRCKSPFAESHVVQNSFDFTKNDINSFTIDNKGWLDIKPVLQIIKVGDGDIKIINSTKAYSDFILTDLKNNEHLVIDCKKHYINSSLGTERYDNFNHNYLSLPYGMNRLRIEGKCVLVIRYSYKYRALSL
ncbi:distal tail protein Dit [Niallia sp. FSL M8-0099]|uniref:distal tail protein Dit n=1 Tax=Niallia sp. FSL M8-0099 TaxID=2954519 RepID=UPI0030F62D7C